MICNNMGRTARGVEDTRRVLQDVNTDQQNNGLQALLTYDRPTAARLA